MYVRTPSGIWLQAKRVTEPEEDGREGLQRISIVTFMVFGNQEVTRMSGEELIPWEEGLAAGLLRTGMSHSPFADACLQVP